MLNILKKSNQALNTKTLQSVVVYLYVCASSWWTPLSPTCFKDCYIHRLTPIQYTNNLLNCLLSTPMNEDFVVVLYMKADKSRKRK